MVNEGMRSWLQATNMGLQVCAGVEPSHLKETVEEIQPPDWDVLPSVVFFQV